MKKKFVNSLVYNFAKKGGDSLELKNKPFYNIRNSYCLKKFQNCLFKIHTGKAFVVNEPQTVKSVMSKYTHFKFKLGQFSYNKKIFIKGRRTKEYSFIMTDLKKKNGLKIKIKKKKRSVFVFKK